MCSCINADGCTHHITPWVLCPVVADNLIKFESYLAGGKKKEKKKKKLDVFWSWAEVAHR
jgi:hypothetical protein